MTVKLTYTKSEQGREELAKRQYMPGYVLEAPCPTCGLTMSRDFGQDYLSYPVPDEPARAYLCCDGCDDVEVEIDVVVRMSLELVPVEGAKA